MNNLLVRKQLKSTVLDLKPTNKKDITIIIKEMVKMVADLSVKDDEKRTIINNKLIHVLLEQGEEK